MFTAWYEATKAKHKILALDLLTAIIMVHGCFLKIGIRIQNFLGRAKVGFILFMALKGVYVMVFEVKPTHRNFPPA